MQSIGRHIGIVMGAALMCAHSAVAARLVEAGGRQNVPPSLAEASPYMLENSAVLSVASPRGERYSIMLAWPDTPPPPAGWPVLYVLDGEDNFAMVALAARRLARAGTRSGVVPGVVVGVAAGPLTRRVRDYTPPVAGYSIPAGQPAAGLATGGGDAFLDMMERQVMPLVHERLPVDDAREALLGHSFGALIGLHALFTRPAMFETVVAVSPSLWFGNGLIAQEAASTRTVSGDLLMAVGSEERARGAAPDEAAALIARVRALVPGRRAELVTLAGQNHGNSLPAALADAIGFAFRAGPGQ